MSKTLSKTDKATKLAIIFTNGGGSSWFQGSDDIYVMAHKAAKCFKRDWKHLFKIPKEHKFCVHIYDISEAQGWSADYSGNVTCLESKKDCPYIQKIYVVI